MKNYVIIKSVMFGCEFLGNKGDYVETHHEKNIDVKRAN
jgi:hypothetical protein